LLTFSRFAHPTKQGKQLTAVMKILLIAAGSFLLTATALLQASDLPSNSNGRSPVLVELFTSEGCSSCPPADALLQKLDQQPITGEEMIVLSEHVDYWNHEGWKDPYSARFYSERQGAYAKRLGLSDVYTPQMIVDGSTQLVGSDAGQADKALQKAATDPKVALRLSSVSLGSPDVLHAHLETDALAPSFGLREADVYVVVALNRAESQVARGENAGRKLTHTAVVKSIVKVGTIRKGKTFIQDLQLKLDPGTDAGNLRLIAFLQEPGQGRVIGAAEEMVPAVAHGQQ
jgi:hypothetical protein